MVDPTDPPDSREDPPDSRDLRIPPERGRPDRRAHGKAADRLDDDEMERRAEDDRDMIRRDQESQ